MGFTRIKTIVFGETSDCAGVKSHRLGFVKRAEQALDDGFCTREFLSYIGAVIKCDSVIDFEKLGLITGKLEIVFENCHDRLGLCGTCFWRLHL